MNTVTPKQLQPSAPHRALLLCGGWEGHSPQAFCTIIAEDLRATGCEVTTATELAVLDNAEALATFDLIVPNWTMGQLNKEQEENLAAAIEAGCGLGGFHGGMGDAFRGNLTYEWICGGHFVGHPHVGEYVIRQTEAGKAHTASACLQPEFTYNSEQYYMLLDPSIEVLADTCYTYEGRTCTMPVIWTKSWGKGRVFYSALGHAPEEFSRYPQVRKMTVNGLLWVMRVRT